MANREMFQRIDKILEEFPELHHQNFWEAAPEVTDSCGTTRCVAGWAVWLKAVDLGLMSRKRDAVSNDIVRAVAEHYDLASITPIIATDVTFEKLGAAILGLNENEAASLFYDLNNYSVSLRVRSYATTGSDLPDEEMD